MGADLNAQWVKIATVKFNDAGYALAATTATIDCPPLTSPALDSKILILETIVHERVQFVHAAGTLTLDVGTSGATEELVKDVLLETTAGTSTLGSGTTSVKPRLIRAKGYVPRLTFTASAGNLSTSTAGEVDIFLLVGACPKLN